MAEEQSDKNSIAALIPQWYEGGTREQMFDEAIAQIRLILRELLNLLLFVWKIK